MMNSPSGTTGRLVRKVSALVGMVLALTIAGIATPANAVDGPLTVVSLTFDDSNADQLTAVDLMNASGLAGTFFTVSGYVGAPGYFTRDQLTQISAEGHEIGGHTVTHEDLTTVSAAEAKLQVCQDRATLASWGFAVRSFAYPFAAVDGQAMTAAQNCNYNSGRGLGDIRSRFGCSGCDYAETMPPEEPFYTKALDQVDSTWTLQDLTSAVTNAETTGGWVQFTFHHVCDSCDSLSISPGLFQQFTQWLAARATTNNTVVRTVGDVVGGAVKPIVPPDIAPAPGPGVNGLVNPGLETAGSGATPQCWQIGGYGTNTATFSRVSPGRTGLAAEQLVMTNYADGDAKLLPTLDIGACAPTVTPGHTYSLRAWYTSTTVTQFAVYLRQSAGSWIYWTSSPWFAPSATYTEARWDTPVIPEGVTGISFGLNLFQNGTLVTDDYALYDTVGAPAPLGNLVPVTPTISGTAKVGQQLTALPGTWTPSTVTFTYQWLRSGVAIAGATASTYTAVAGDAGAALSVSVTGSAPGYNSATGTASATSAVLPGDLTAQTPTITGTAEVGRVLTANPGAWGPGTVTFTYQWLRGSTTIAGATSATYTAGAADVGSTLSVDVTGSQPGYTSATRSASTTATVSPGGLTAPIPVITGSALVGQVLTASVGTWAPAPVALSYVWLRDGAAIPGATNPSYTVVAADLAKQLSVQVTGTKAGYATVARTSATVTVTQSSYIVSRLFGADRYATAVTMSQGYAPGVAKVYVVSGQSYPDGLSASAAAAHFDGPVLLTRGDRLPAVVNAELKRLAPTQIVVVGGTGAVSGAVVLELKKIAPVLRVSGADRYATSRAVALQAFGAGGATTAYIATGADFPDALSASPAAAHVNGPVILVPGNQTRLDSATTALLTTLGVTSVKIAGGTGSVSLGIENALKLQLGAGNVKRLAGSDRFATAVAVNRDAFSSSGTVYLVASADFADALSGAALSGAQDAPLFFSKRDCVPRAVLDSMSALGSDHVVLLGGTGMLSDRVLSLTPCS